MLHENINDGEFNRKVIFLIEIKNISKGRNVGRMDQIGEIWRKGFKIVEREREKEEI